MLVWHDDCPFSIHSLPSSISNFESSFLNLPTSNLLHKSSVHHLPQSLVKSTGYLTLNVLKIAGFPTKSPQAPLALLAAFSRSG